MRKITFALSLILLIILILSAYCNTFFSPPILDDFHTFVREHRVYLEELSITNLLSISESTFGWSRWIPMATFALDQWVGGGKIVYFHLTNIIVHILTMFSVFALVFVLINSVSNKDTSWDLPPFSYAVWVAGVWALSPVQTNAVTYLVQRMASIQTLFYVSAVCFYLLGRSKQKNTERFSKALLFYFLCLASSLCAFLSKPNSAMLPFMLFLTELWFFSPDLFPRFLQKLRKRNWSAVILLVMGALGLVLLIYEAYSYSIGGYRIRHFTMSERLMTEARIVVWYMSLLLLPLPSRMSIEHDVVISKSIIHPPTTLAAILFLCVIGYLIVRFRRKCPLITYGGLWFFVNLTIESTIVPLELIFEHRLYLPSVGFYLALVLGLVRIGKRILGGLPKPEFAKVGWSFFAILVSCLTLLTFQRNEAWRNFLTINQDAAIKAPNHHRAHANYAVALMRAERYEEAIREAERAIELGRPHFESYMVAANVIVGSLGGLGRLEEAAQRGEELLADSPDSFDAGAFPIVCLQIAETYRHLGRLDKAYTMAVMALRHGKMTYYQQKLVEGMLAKILSKTKEESIDLNGDGRADPGSQGLKVWIAKEFLKYKRRDAAKELLKKATLDDPSDLEARKLLVRLEREEKINKEQASKGDFLHKYVHRPFSRFNMYMAAAYLIRKERLPAPFFGIGETFLHYAMELNPSSPDVYLLRGWYLSETGRIQDALKMVKKAIELDPEYAKAWIGLGFFSIRANQPEVAVNAFKKTLELYPGYPKKAQLVEFIARASAGDKKQLVGNL